MTKEEKLADILERLEGIKSEFADVVDKYENDYADDQTMDFYEVKRLDLMADEI